MEGWKEEWKEGWKTEHIPHGMSGEERIDLSPTGGRGMGTVEGDDRSYLSQAQEDFSPASQTVSPVSKM